MFLHMHFAFLTAVLVTAAFGRTVRYQIVTRDDGTKEILNNQGVSPSTDIKVLAQDLNASVTLAQSSTTESAEDFGPAEALVLAPEPTNPLADTPLLDKLNSYTANGWTGQKNAVYANSTKLTIYDGGEEVHQVHSNLIKKGRSENFTGDPAVVEVAIDQPGLWEVIERLYDCFTNSTKFGGTMECLRLRVTSMFYKFVDQSVHHSMGKSEDLKSFKHGKKVLKGALLPLLVLLVIKYLVALPVIAAGLVTIKTFWLSLLSAGVAAFGAPWKHHHHTTSIKRYRPEIETIWPQPPWTYGLHSKEVISKADTPTLPVAAPDKFFM